MDPVTVLAIAQAGVQLYSMSRSSKAGIGGLLAVQTQLLMQIIEQIGVLNQKLDLIYASITKLEKIVRQLPREVALEILKRGLTGTIGNSFDHVRTYQANCNRFGRLKAVSMVKDAAILTLDSLQDRRQQLMDDSSDALIPLVSSAWYAEYHLLCNCLPFDEERLNTTIMRYQRAFKYWSEKTKRELTQCDIDIKELAAKSPQYQSGTWCYHSIQTSSKHWGCGHDGNNDCYKFGLSAIKSVLNGVQLDKDENLLRYRSELLELKRSGRVVDLAYFDFKALQWNIEAQRVVLFTVESTRDAQALEKAVSSISKDVRNSTSHDDFVKAERAKVQSFELITLRKIVYEHFQMICESTLTSLETVRSRYVDS